MSKETLKTFVVSGTFWVPSYGDFDCDDFRVEAKDHEHAREVAKKNPYYRLAKGEPCIQSLKEWNEMWERISEKYP